MLQKVVETTENHVDQLKQSIQLADILLAPKQVLWCWEHDWHSALVSLKYKHSKQMKAWKIVFRLSHSYSHIGFPRFRCLHLLKNTSFICCYNNFFAFLLSNSAGTDLNLIISFIVVCFAFKDILTCLGVKVKYHLSLDNHILATDRDQSIPWLPSKDWALVSIEWGDDCPKIYRSEFPQQCVSKSRSSEILLGTIASRHRVCVSNMPRRWYEKTLSHEHV